MRQSLGGFLAFLLAWAPAASVAQSPPFSFEIKPETTLDMGRPATLQARWTRSRPPGWVISFQYRRDPNSPWITVHATSDAGELLHTASGQLIDYVCDSGDCQLVVNPQLTNPTRLEFRGLAANTSAGQSLASAEIIAVQWIQPVVAPPPAPPPRANSRLTFTLTTNGVPCTMTFEMPRRRGESTTLSCRSTIDGPAAANSGRVNVAPDGSVPQINVRASWTGFQDLTWGWQVAIRHAGVETVCAGTLGACQSAIPARPAGSVRENSIGRDSVVAILNWNGSGGANPNTAPPSGFYFQGFSIEQTIDYLR